ncbi:MAG: polysaccharide deacetylase [Ruminococcaceae bacterium]|nr:polysaccharide deacetylase [Oscillospiraceae bacterium]
MDKKRIVTISVTVLSVVLIIFSGILIAILLGDTGNGGSIQIHVPTAGATSVPTQPTEPLVTDPPITEPPVTEPPVTEPSVTEPPETQPPTTGPTVYQPDMNELIGNLYTREQLAAIDGTRRGYGAGKSVNGARPAYAVSNQKAYGTLYNAHFIAPDNGKVYLTFTHGYEQNNLTGIVLDALKEKGVKAVFFINRDYARLAPEMVWRMVNEGHIVGNHATKHPDMGQQTVDQMVSEIMTMHNYMVENFGYEMKLFRPPSGYYSARLLAVAQSLGYTTVQWSYTYRDWDRNAPPKYEAFLADIVASVHSGAIFYFHTVTPSGVQAVCDSIDAIRAKGYEFDLFTGEFE